MSVLPSSPRGTAPAAVRRTAFFFLIIFRSGLMAIPLQRLRAFAHLACVFAVLTLATTTGANAQPQASPANTAGDFSISVEPGAVATSRESSVFAYVVLTSLDQFSRPTVLRASG